MSSGMGAVKSPNPNGRQLLLVIEWMLWTPTQHKNLTSLLGYQLCWVNGMDAVKSNPKDASSYLGYHILLSSEQDALKSPNLMAARSW